MYSTKTAQDALDYVVRQRGLPDLSAQLVRDALNEFYTLYYKAEEQANRARLRKSVEIDTTGGYALSLISDLGDDYFEVFKVVAGQPPNQRLPQVLPYEEKEGFYVENEKIYTTAQMTDKVIQVYYTKGVSEITSGVNLEDHTLKVVKTADFVVFKFLLQKFYDNKLQFGLKNEVEQEFMNDLARLFKKPVRGFFTGLNPY